MKQRLFYFQITISKLIPVIFGISLSSLMISPTFSQVACGVVIDEPINNCYSGNLTVYQGLCGGNNITFTMSSNPISPIQLCDGFNSVLNNPSYFAFLADGSGSFSITVEPIAGTCQNNLGIQAALVGTLDCNTLMPFSNPCQTDCTQGSFTLSTDFIPTAGQVIVVVLDGCSGDICDVNFTINSGWTNSPTPPEVDLMLQSQVSNDGTLSCGEMTFTVEPPFKDVCEYVWTLPDGTIIITEQTSITLNVNDFPNGNICVQGINEDCFPGEFFPSDPTGTSLCLPFIRQDPEIELSVDATTCGRDDGFTFVVSETGLPPFNYEWSNGIGTSINPNLPPGTYTITVTDAKGCEVIDSVFIASSDSISAEIEIVQPDCGENNGSIKINTPGSNSMDYDFSWFTHPWLNSDSLIDLSPGLYNVTITDKLDPSCSIVFSNIEILEGIDVNIEEIYHSDMFSNNGFIRFSVENGVEFKYFLTTPTGVLEGVDSIIGNLAPAKYKLEIVSQTDDDCKFLFEFVIKGFNRPVPSVSIRRHHVIVFPNPVNDILYIEGIDGQCSYELYNLSGELLLKSEMVKNSINLEIYPRGIYFLRIISDSGESSVKKIVKI